MFGIWFLCWMHLTKVPANACCVQKYQTSYLEIVDFLFVWLISWDQVKSIALNFIWLNENSNIKPLSFRMNDARIQLDLVSVQFGFTFHWAHTTFRAIKMNSSTQWHRYEWASAKKGRKKDSHTRYRTFTKCRIIMNAIRRNIAKAAMRLRATHTIGLCFWAFTVYLTI